MNWVGESGREDRRGLQGREWMVDWTQAYYMSV